MNNIPQTPAYLETVDLMELEIMRNMTTKSVQKSPRELAEHIVQLLWDKGLRFERGQ